ncbi:MAG TPA: translation elongation factor Ts [Myxococcota bacterium]|nr:translation elongation factor Ts [Myxococcota bacterium]
MAEISAKDVKTLREQTGAGMMDCKRALADAAGDFEQATKLLRERGFAKGAKREGRATSEGAISIAIAGRVGAMVELGCETDFVARTDAFIALGERLARAVADDPKIASVDALLAAPIDGEKASDRVAAAIALLGENVVVKRTARLAVDAGVVGGYVHAGGKLGVLVALKAADAGAALPGLAKDIAMHIAAADPSPVAVDRAGIPPALLASEREIYRKQAMASGKPEKILDKIVDGKVDKFVSEVALVEQPFVKDPDRSVGQLLAAHGAVNVTAFERFKLGQSEEAQPE